MEEGEILRDPYLNEEDNPYIADPNFKFRLHDPLHKINWRSIDKVDFKGLRYGSLGLST